MIELKTEFFPQAITMSLRNTDYLLMLFLLAPLAFPLSLFADNHYMFPSDVVDEAEQTNVELEGSNRYATQREWSYPEETSTDARGKVISGKTSLYYSKDYRSIGGQSSPHQVEPNYGSSRYPEPDQYKYDNFNAKTPPANPLPANPSAYNNSRLHSPDGQGDSQYNAPDIHQYPYESDYKYPRRRNFQQVMPVDPMAFPQPEYVQENYNGNYDGNIETRDSNQPYPNLLFPGDIDADKQFMNPKYRALTERYRYGRQAQQLTAPGQVRYVPVPVYGVPGTLPGTVPGVVTPGNMVPGYSHLTPNYSGYNNYFGTPFMPVNPFNSYMYPGNPFGSLYNNYGNNSFSNMPFTNPNYMMPGLSMPGMFSPSKSK